MDKETQELKENVDSWVKQIRKEIAELNDLPQIVYENTGNIKHSYELIYELKDEIENLKQEINALKLIQILSLKQSLKEKEKERILHPSEAGI